jgi:peptidoglycan/LPS O-acetylase OafA/YrhL
MASTAFETAISAQPVPIPRGRFQELDGVRAFGVTTIIVAHMWPYPHGSRVVWDTLHLSWILMDLFFVLSGFLIAGILLDTRNRPDYYRSFYSRRALRILPVYYLVIAALTASVMVHGSGLLYPANPELHKWGSPWWYFVYLGNIPPAFTGVTPTLARGCFSPLWSLQIEEQFYLLFPLLVRRLNPRNLGKVLWCLVLFSPLLRVVLYFIYPNNHLIQYVFLPCRMDGLGLGSLIALRFRTGSWYLPKFKLSVAVLAGLAFTLACAALNGFDLSTPFNRTIGFFLSPVSCAGLVIWLACFRGSSLTGFLRTAPLRHLGNISYSAYLLHCPVAVGWTAIAKRIGVPSLSEGHFRPIFVFIFTVGVCSLSWRFLEQPMMDLKDRLFPQRQPSATRAVPSQVKVAAP